MAKVAAEAGQNQALIGYHFGGKQGLVAAVARRVTERITADVLAAVAGAERIESLAGDALDAVWHLMELDEGLQRVYFDLAAQSTLDPEIQVLMADVKAGYREILGDRIGRLAPALTAAQLEAAAVFVMAGIEGLALQRLDRGDTSSLHAARRIWVRSVGAVLDED
jgi:AcrR family transcriptional regulator